MPIAVQGDIIGAGPLTPTVQVSDSKRKYARVPHCAL
jgi:hypothetical protein